MQLLVGLYMASGPANYEELNEIWTELAEDWSREMLISMIAHKEWCYYQLEKKLKRHD